MSLRIVEVSDEEDFLAIARVLYISFHDPFGPLYELLNELEGTVEEQIEKKAKRHASQWKASPARHWFKLIEQTSDSEQVVAVCSWQILPKPPDVTVDPVADWHPKGSALRKYSTQWVRGLGTVKAPYKRHPHIGNGHPITISMRNDNR